MPIASVTHNPAIRPLAGLYCTVVALLFAAMPLRAGSEDPRVWIARMNDTLTKRNYDGVFVHQLGGKRETLRIIHRVKNGQMTERLVSTDGSGREFIRRGSEWTAYFPDRRIVVVEQRSRAGFINGLRGLGDSAEAHYEIRDLERARVQGRSTRVITVTPRDSFRYGYRLWVDEKTAMPVRTQLATANNEIIEEISFVTLSFPDTIDDELLKADVDASAYRWLRRDPQDNREEAGVTFAPREDLLPPGFRVSGWHAAHKTTGKGPRSSFVFTDGLAWVSVFIEPADVPPPLSRLGTPRRAEGPAQLGASAAFTARTEGFRITAVGEVPPLTVKAIAESIRSQ